MMTGALNECPKGAIFLALAIACLGATSIAAAAEPASETRLDEVARRGAQVMPFDMDRTTHVFTATRSGGIQQVLVKEPNDSSQIRRIRAHLREIAEAFGRGDFSAPASIHGDAMPGLAQLRAAAPGQLKIDYRDLETGGQIEYATTKPDLVEAIHEWFEAQLSDHHRHAMPGHGHPQSHSP